MDQGLLMTKGNRQKFAAQCVGSGFRRYSWERGGVYMQIRATYPSPIIEPYFKLKQRSAMGRTYHAIFMKQVSHWNIGERLAKLDCLMEY